MLTVSTAWYRTRASMWRCTRWPACAMTGRRCGISWWARERTSPRLTALAGRPGGRRSSTVCRIAVRWRDRRGVCDGDRVRGIVAGGRRDQRRGIWHRIGRGGGQRHAECGRGFRWRAVGRARWGDGNRRPATGRVGGVGGYRVASGGSRAAARDGRRGAAGGGVASTTGTASPARCESLPNVWCRRTGRR